jgi:hypothetical protein
MKSLEKEGSRNAHPLLTVSSVLLLSIAKMPKTVLSCTVGLPSSLVLLVLVPVWVVAESYAPAFASKVLHLNLRPPG